MSQKAGSTSGETGPASSKEDMISKRRKELFGDCALIEIIHLHDCLRGALKALEADVSTLAIATQKHEEDTLQKVSDLERRVAGRFQVIWSVFRAHSSAEDEFIWPALQQKTQGRIGADKHSRKYRQGGDSLEVISSKSDDDVIEQEEYEEDHASEERMFSEMDTLLATLREVLVRERRKGASATAGEATKPVISVDVDSVAQDLSKRTRSLSQHLMTHLEKEETQCMPLVVKQ